MDTNIPLNSTNDVAAGLMRIREVVSYLNVSRSHVYAMMNRGIIPYVRLGRSRRVPRNALMRIASELVECNAAAGGTGQ